MPDTIFTPAHTFLFPINDRPDKALVLGLVLVFSHIFSLHLGPLGRLVLNKLAGRVPPVHRAFESLQSDVSEERDEVACSPCPVVYSAIERKVGGGRQGERGVVVQVQKDGDECWGLAVRKGRVQTV